MAENPPSLIASPHTQPGAPDVIIVANDPAANAPHLFPSNFIQTAKYNLLTFLPLNLFYQFRRVSNFYFLVNMIFALIPGVSPINPATSVLPLVFVVGVALIKDGYEDYQRHQADNRANSMPTKVVRPKASAAAAAAGSGGDGGAPAASPTTPTPTRRAEDYELVQVASRDVAVGDIIYITLGEEVRADVLLLSSSLAESQAFIDTCNLDGETNLKSRKGVEATWGLHSVETIVPRTVVIRTGHPDPGLLFWTGTVTVDGRETAVGLDQFLYRSCVLRNTDWVWGIVIYAGVDTKMFRNLQEKPPKSSTLDDKLNYMILAVLVVQVSLLIIVASLSCWWNSTRGYDHWYARYYVADRTGITLWGYRFLTYFILLSYMIPISLFVTIELCKVMQAKFMAWDTTMVEWMGGKWVQCVPNTSNLNEQLSQVNFIFSDKTGTLTENVMTFKLGNALGFPIDSADQETSRGYLRAGGAAQAAAEDYFLALALCHTIQPFDDPHNHGHRIYEGASPDEVALVQCAAAHGYVLTERTVRGMTLEIQGVVTKFEILATLEFTPDRKMMSMVMRNLTTGAIFLYTKGADSFVIPQLSAAAAAAPSASGGRTQLQATKDVLIDMSLLGLRTLLVCRKDLSQADFDAWNARFIEAGKALVDRSAIVDKVCLEMERELRIVGCTAIEDRLQDQVPETLRFFLDAGVIVWMLTGDKRETAVTIAATSSLANPLTDHIDHIDIGDLDMKSDEAAARVLEQLVVIENHITAKDKKVTFVVDGPALTVCFKKHFDMFLRISQLVNSAVCCRLTPLQKANVVRMFQQATGKTAIAIGDGANDVSMIQEGRVGVGIVGLEGAQAALAADYAIPRFKHLRQLCAVHGRYALVRNAICTMCSFYKNVLLSLTQFYFAFYTGFSGMTLYNGWLLTFYNIAFTSVPPLFLGMFEKDLCEPALMKQPELFIPLRHGAYFDAKTQGRWFVQALVHSFILFFLSLPTNQHLDHTEGRSMDGQMFGTILITSMVLLALGKMSLHVRYWNWLPAFSIVISVLMYIGFILIYSAIPNLFGETYFYYAIYMLMAGPKFWLYILLFVAGILVPCDLAVLHFQKQRFPTPRDLAEEKTTEESG